MGVVRTPRLKKRTDTERQALSELNLGFGKSSNSGDIEKQRSQAGKKASDDDSLSVEGKGKKLSFTEKKRPVKTNRSWALLRIGTRSDTPHRRTAAGGRIRDAQTRRGGKKEEE